MLFIIGIHSYHGFTFNSYDSNAVHINFGLFLERRLLSLLLEGEGKGLRLRLRLGKNSLSCLILSINSVFEQIRPAGRCGDYHHHYDSVRVST